MIQARPWVSPEVLFNFGRPELSPWINFGYFFLYQTFAIFSIMKILDNVCPFSFLWAHHRANHVLRQLMEWDVSRENIQPRTSFTLRSVRVNISKCLEIILDCRKSGRRAGKHIVPSFLIFQTNTKTMGCFFFNLTTLIYCLHCKWWKKRIWYRLALLLLLILFVQKPVFLNPKRQKLLRGTSHENTTQKA